MTLTINDDDDAPTLSIDSPSVTEGNSGSANLTFTVSLNPASGKQVTVAYAEGTGGTATSGTDYTALSGGTLTFAAGDTSKTVTVTVRGDTTDEPNETVVVALSSPTNATVSSTAGTGTGTITDDDDAADGDPGAVAEFDRGERRDQLGDRDGEPGPGVKSAADDHHGFRGSSGGGHGGGRTSALSSNTTLTIAAGNTSSSGTVTVTAVDNTRDEANKSVTVSGSATNSQRNHAAFGGDAGDHRRRRDADGDPGVCRGVRSRRAARPIRRR